MSIHQTQLAVTSTDIIPASSGNIGSLSIFFYNSDTVTRNVTVHVIKSGGGAASATNQILNYDIQTLDTIGFDWERIALDAGDKVVAICDAGAVVTVTSSFITL
jgi:hypothetical protein